MDGTQQIDQQDIDRRDIDHRDAADSGSVVSGQPRTSSATACALLAELWADEAARGLSRRMPALSAHNHAFPTLVALLAGLALAAIIAAPLARLPLIGMLPVAMSPACLVLAGLRIAGAVVPERHAPRNRLPGAVLPAASVIVALYREAAVVPQLLKALQAIDYPPDRLEIRLAIEADDTATRAALETADLDPRFAIVVVPPGEPRTKPRALNYALRFCTGDIVAVHDAEDRPHPRQLRTAAESFAATPPDLACLQAPLNWYNRDECWLTRQFAMEYAAHFHTMLPLYQRLGWPLPLGGTSNYFRARALRRAGGWDAWNVTEDADLGLRLHRLGYRCGLIASTTLEEAPVRLAAWTPQRTRWLKGYWQTLIVHFGLDPQRRRQSGPLALTLGGAVLSALVHGPTIPACLLAAGLAGFGSPAALTFLGVLGAGYLAGVASIVAGMRRAGLRLRAADLVSLPAYWALQTVPAVRALLQLVRNPYLWEKTEHGVSALAEPTCTSHSPPRSSPSASPSRSSSSPAGAQASRSARSADRA